jgi:lipopolysaccharide/colanic/teichoic acid biosynthesis glycosyltransferase
VPGVSPLSLTVKRLLDLILVLVALLLLWPVLLLVALAVWLSMGRPVLFSQTRPGRNERAFRMYKFRTMTDARDAAGGLLPDARRLTRLGRFLRKTSLDELPELWNVLKGEMSLVGPRPLLMRYLPYYTPRERKRALVLPGITGWAQVKGRNFVSWDERFALDVWYVENRSLWLDVKILFLTVGAVLSARTVAVDTALLGKNLDEARQPAEGWVP